MVERASLIALLQAASMMIGLVSSERLIWSDEFDSLDESVWIHTVTTFPQESVSAHSCPNWFIFTVVKFLEDDLSL